MKVYGEKMEGRTEKMSKKSPPEAIPRNRAGSALLHSHLRAPDPGDAVVLSILRGGVISWSLV
jgi:hypothetical protein